MATLYQDLIRHRIPVTWLTRGLPCFITSSDGARFPYLCVANTPGNALGLAVYDPTPALKGTILAVGLHRHSR